VSFDIELVLGSDIPTGGKVVFELPKLTQYYEGRGINSSSDSMVVSTFYEKKYNYKRHEETELLERRKSKEFRKELQKQVDQVNEWLPLEEGREREEYLSFYESFDAEN